MRSIIFPRTLATLDHCRGGATARVAASAGRPGEWDVLSGETKGEQQEENCKFELDKIFNAFLGFAFQ